MKSAGSHASKLDGVNSVETESGSHSELSSSSIEVNKIANPATRSKDKSTSKGSMNSTSMVKKPRNVRTAEKLIKRYNRWKSEEDVLTLFAGPLEAKCLFEDGFTITLKEWAAAAKEVKASFPDMRFDYEAIKEIGTGKVAIEGLRFSGTHTGDPFTFAAAFPAIPPTGIRVVNDEERLELEIKDGKISGMLVISIGLHTGPAGVYEKIGGSLIPPNTAED